MSRPAPAPTARSSKSWNDVITLVRGRPVPSRVQIKADQGPSAVSRVHRRGSAQSRKQQGRSGALVDESRRPRFPRRGAGSSSTCARAISSWFVRSTVPERPSPKTTGSHPRSGTFRVNGRWGHSFSSPDLTVDQVAAIVRAQGPLGASRLCPTLITAPPDHLIHGVSTIAAACEHYPDVAARVLGIHLEGPFISEREGYRGAHAAKWAIRDPDWGLIQNFRTRPEAESS